MAVLRGSHHIYAMNLKLTIFSKFLLTVYSHEQAQTQNMSSSIRAPLRNGSQRNRGYQRESAEHESPLPPADSSPPGDLRWSAAYSSETISSVSSESEMIDGAATPQEVRDLAWYDEELELEVSAFEAVDRYMGATDSASSEDSGGGPNLGHRAASIRVVPRLRGHGASSQAISSLKTIRYSGLRETDDICAICLDNYSNHNIIESDDPGNTNDRGHIDVLQLPCGHNFGASCIKIWLQEHHTCPSCRDELEVATTEECFFSDRNRSWIRTTTLENLASLSRTRPQSLEWSISSTEETVPWYINENGVENGADRSENLRHRSGSSLEAPFTPPESSRTSFRDRRASTISAYSDELPWGPVMEFAMSGRPATTSAFLPGWRNADDNSPLIFPHLGLVNVPRSPEYPNDQPPPPSTQDANPRTPENHNDPGPGGYFDLPTSSPPFESQQETRYEDQPNRPIPLAVQCLEDIVAARWPRSDDEEYIDPWTLNPSDDDTVDDTSGWNDTEAVETEVEPYWPKSDFVEVVRDQSADEEIENGAEEIANEWFNTVSGGGSDDYDTDNEDDDGYDPDDEDDIPVRREGGNKKSPKLLRMLGRPDISDDDIEW